MSPASPRQLLAAVALAAFAPWASAETAGEAELARRVDQLAVELAAVKAELAALKDARTAGAPAPTVPAATPAATAAAGGAPRASSAGTPAASVVAAAPLAPAQPQTVVSSYGEINYNRPTGASQNAQADLRRFVIGLQHRTDDRTKIVSELEVEHAVSSADDHGEVEVEQAYVERQLSPTWSARAGLFLIPAGLLNENHEPTAYYGVERNFVETAIIPTTWREGGVQFVGAFDNGLTLQTGITTGFDLTKWDATSAEGRESPLGSIHQELQLARAKDLSVFGALNWRGVPGLLFGGSVFTGGATHGQAAISSRVTLWDLHARWTPGRWDLSALYASGSISNTAALNAPLVGSATLIPSRFDGWYVQGAYQLWSKADYALSPFARWEQFNTARAFADLGPGLTPAAAPTERVVTLGANLKVTPEVVLKADYQRFRENKDANRVDLGLGWSF
jgi:hypothetical protein